MKYFKDSTNNSLYALEDDVVVTKSDAGVYSFTTALGVELKTLPTTLQPFTPVAPTEAELVLQAKSVKNAELNLGCSNAITSGFTATPITGTTYTYPSDTTSQINIMSAVSSGGVIWCSADAGQSWEFVSHTAEEAGVVQAAMFAMIQANQKKYASLLTSVQAASTVDAVNAIVWSS